MVTKKTYKELQAELDRVLGDLQSTELDIDNALELYKQGQKLIEQLEDYLQNAKNEIVQLKKMTWLLLVTISLVLVFGVVVFFGAPYLPTLRKQTNEAFDLLDLKPGQTLVELGSGDGRLMREAAKRGIYSVGYELNPILVIWTMWRNLKYRDYITVHWANYWRRPLPITDAIYTFLLDKYMVKLDTKIEQDMKRWDSKKQLKLVSFAFKIPGKKPIKELNGLNLYTYK